MTTRTMRSKTAYVAAATELIEEHGAAGFTVRTLAEKMGVDHTAVYRHFASLDDLTGAIVDNLMGEMLEFQPSPRLSPRRRLEAFVLNVHEVFYAHPNLVPLLLRGSGAGRQGDAITRAGLDLLQELGLRGDDLAMCHQMLESFVVGTHAFDLAGAPHHLEVRRQRRRRIDHPELDRSTPTIEAVNELNDRAFRAGVTAIIDYCENLATKKSRG